MDNFEINLTNTPEELLADRHCVEMRTAFGDERAATLMAVSLNLRRILSKYLENNLPEMLMCVTHLKELIEHVKNKQDNEPNDPQAN